MALIKCPAFLEALRNLLAAFWRRRACLFLLVHLPPLGQAGSEVGLGVGDGGVIAADVDQLLVTVDVQHDTKVELDLLPVASITSTEKSVILRGEASGRDTAAF